MTGPLLRPKVRLPLVAIHGDGRRSPLGAVSETSLGKGRPGLGASRPGLSAVLSRALL